MKDFYFYTLSASFVAISIAIAMMQSTGPKVSDECIVENGYIVQGKKLENLTSSPGTNFTFMPSTQSSPAYITALSHVPRSESTSFSRYFCCFRP